MTDTTPEPTEGQSTDDIDAIFGSETDEHPDVDPEPPVARATDDPDYDEAEQQEIERAALEEARRAERPRVILSSINDGLGNEQVVGWDTCGKCLRHIRICNCTDGPFRPSYVEKFAFTDDKPSIMEIASYVEGGDMVEGTMHAGSLTEKELVDIEPELTPTGRRKRKDAGKPRKPRDTEATQAAAEALNAAVRDRSTDG